MDSSTSSQISKPFKLCFNNEIHRISKLPSDYRSLVENVHMAFKSSLPLNWALQYEDADGDRIMLTSDEDYRAMLECENDSSSKSVKIFLLPLEERAPTDMSSSKINLCDISKTESMEFSRILENQEKVSQKPSEEPVPEMSEEIPQQEEVSQQVEEERQESVEQPREPEVEITEEVASTQVPEEKEEESQIQPNKEEPTYVDVAIDVSNENHFRHRREDGEHHRPRCGFRWGQHREERRQRMKGMINESMIENIPAIAELVKEYLSNPAAFNVEEIKKRSQPQPQPQEEVKAEPVNKKVVHNRVICDGCSVNPIIGVRYKCSVCQDFDYCEKCEASVEHPHPFLKIKDPKHHPRAMITILEEDLPRLRQVQDLGASITEKFAHFSKETRDQMSKAISGITEKLFNNTNVQKEEVIPEMVEEPVQKEEEKPVQMEKKEENAVDVVFTKEICTIPARITVNDKAIYKTISLKNTGRTEWPSSAFVRNVDGVSGQDTRVVQLAPGKEFSCILILDNPAQAGDYTSSWRLTFHDEKGQIQHAGETFTVNFTVVEPELTMSQVSKKEEVRKIEEKPKKAYSQKTVEAARQLKEIFPEADIDHLLEIVSQSPRMSLEELIESYLAGSQ